MLPVLLAAKHRLKKTAPSLKGKPISLPCLAITAAALKAACRNIADPPAFHGTGCSLAVKIFTYLSILCWAAFHISYYL